MQDFIEHKVQSEIRGTSKGEANGGDRLNEIKARREELKLAREKRELVPLLDAIFAMDQVAAAITLELNNVPARYS